MMNVNMAISDANKAKGAELLNSLLADEFVLYVKTRNAHWNVEGPDFHAQHKFFESQYESLDDVIDDVAERVRVLGKPAAGSLAQFLSLTQLEETPAEGNSSLILIKSLLTTHEAIMATLHQQIGQFADELKDPGTSDFLTGLLETHQKMAWMLAAHL